MSIPSNTSETDLAIFQHLANPKRVDFNKGKVQRSFGEGDTYQNYGNDASFRYGNENSPAPVPAQYNQEMRPPLLDDLDLESPAAVAIDPRYLQSGNEMNQRFQFASPSSPILLARPSASSRFAQHVNEHMSHANANANGNRFVPSNSHFNLQFNSQQLKMPPMHSFVPEQVGNYSQPPGAASAAVAPVDENELRRFHANASVPQFNYGASLRSPNDAHGGKLDYIMQQDDDDTRRVKQRLLQEVDDVEKEGYTFSKKPTMAYTIEEIQFELDHARSQLEMRSTVNWVKDGIPMMFFFLEMLNNKFGPFLPIQGFTDVLLKKMDENPKKYNYVLERLYRRYWRKGSVSPVVEALLVFVGPLAMYMIQNKVGNKMFSGLGGATNHESAGRGHTRDREAEPSNATFIPSFSFPGQDQRETSSVGRRETSKGYDVGPSTAPQPNLNREIFPPPMMNQPALPRVVPTVAPNINQGHAGTSSTRKHLKKPSNSPYLPSHQPPLIPRDSREPEIVHNVIPEPKPKEQEPKRNEQEERNREKRAPSQSQPQRGGGGGGTNRSAPIAPIHITIPPTPMKPRERREAPTMTRLPPMPEFPEEDEKEPELEQEVKQLEPDMVSSVHENKGVTSGNEDKEDVDEMETLMQDIGMSPEEEEEFKNMFDQEYKRLKGE